MNATADRLFFSDGSLDPDRVQRIVDDTLTGAEDLAPAWNTGNWRVFRSTTGG